MEFMLKVLGSFIFWAVYLPIGFVVGCMAVRKFGKASWYYFETGKKGRTINGSSIDYAAEAWFLFTFWMLLCLPFWPLMLLFVLFCLLLKHVVGQGLKHAIVLCGTCIPDFTLQKKED